MASLADRTIRYIGGLVIGQGRFAGERFDVLPWQRRFLRGGLAPGVAESALTLARGGGKSTLVAGIGCAALDGPLSQAGSEILIVASSHEQGGVIFRHVLRFLAPGIERGRFRVQDTVNVSRIVNRESGVMLAVKGSDPRRLHGAAPGLTIGDELAQWPPARIEEMLSALRTASGKIPDSRIILIGTRPASETHPFSAALQDADYSQAHMAAEADPAFQRRTWLKANPGLNAMPDLEAAIRREAKAAQRDETLLAQFRALRLNMGVSDTLAAVLIDADMWRRIEGEADRSGPCAWGVDLGGSAAMSAIAAYWPETGALDVLAAFAGDPPLAARGASDGIGNAYVRMAERRELIVAGGRAVDIPALAVAALHRFGAPTAIAADRWREADLRDALDKADVPVATYEPRGQGYRDGGEDVRMFRRAAAEGRVVPAKSLLLRSAMAEARVVMDPAGNAKLAKQVEGGRRLRARDDAVAAAILAVALGARNAARPKPRRRRYGLAG